MARPWLSHYDDDVRPSLAPYPDKTLLDYLEQLATRARYRDRRVLFKGSAVSYRHLRRREHCVCGGARRARRPARATVWPAPPELPSVSDRRVRRLEGRRDRRRAESHLQRTRARARARFHASRDGRHPDALLRATEAGAGENGRAPRHRHVHQGVLAAAAESCSSRCFGKRRTAIALRSAQGDRWLSSSPARRIADRRDPR